MARTRVDRRDEDWLTGHPAGPEPARHPGDAPPAATVLGRPPMVIRADPSDGSVALWLWGIVVVLLWLVVPAIAVAGYLVG